MKESGKPSPFLHSLSAVMKRVVHLVLQVSFGYAILNIIVISERFVFVKDYLDRTYGKVLVISILTKSFFELLY